MVLRKYLPERSLKSQPSIFRTHFQLPYPASPFICHSYENTRGVRVFFPFWNSCSGPGGTELFSARAFRPQSCQRSAHQRLEMRLTLGILDRQGARSSITRQRLRLAAQLGVQVAARQL